MDALTPGSLTLDYASKICRQAYPPGEHFAVPFEPDVEEVNARGDYAIEAERLAFIDGDRDPWRPMVSPDRSKELLLYSSRADSPERRRPS
jgi:hypothetical protein